MKAIINKKIKLEELFENKGRCWEHTMDFLKQVKYENDFDKYFETIINLYENNVEINYNGKLYCVDKSIFEIIEEPKEELEEIGLLNICKSTRIIDSEYDMPIYIELIEDKINELIENQNKIIRELKDNKKQ